MSTRRCSTAHRTSRIAGRSRGCKRSGRSDPLQRDHARFGGAGDRRLPRPARYAAARRLDRVVRVEPARVGQHPELGALERFRLPADVEAADAERLPVRGLAEHRDHPGPVRDGPPAASRSRATGELRRGHLVGSRGRLGTRFVMPMPSLGQLGRGPRSDIPPDTSICARVMPARCSAGQNRLPGRAKCAFAAAVHSPGLIPTTSSRRRRRQEVVDGRAPERRELASVVNRPAASRHRADRSVRVSSG